MRVLRRIILPLLCVHVVLADIPGYRAIRQLFSLEIRAPATALSAGSLVGVKVVTSGRVEADAILELVQGVRSETLLVKFVKRNWDGPYDPLPKRDSGFVALTSETLGRFTAGPATLRATAHGSMQWLRTPPAIVTERVVEVLR